MVERLTPRPLKRTSIEPNGATYVKKQLSLAVPRANADPQASFRALLRAVDGVDTRELTPASLAAFGSAFAERGEALMQAWGIRHERDGGAFRIMPDVNDTSRMGRFIRALAMHSIGILYVPSAMLEGCTRAAMDGTGWYLLLGSEDIINGNPSDQSLVHEATHLDGAERLRNHEPAWFYGRLRADGTQQGTLPGIRGGYGAFQSIDELRTYSRDLRNLVRIVERRAGETPSLWSRLSRTVRGQLDPLTIDYAYLVLTSRSLLDASLRTVACMKQALARVDDATFSVVDGNVTAFVRVKTTRQPEGYEVAIPLVASHGVDDPQNRELLARQMRWTLEAAHGHMAHARVALQALDTVPLRGRRPPDRNRLRQVCAKLKHVLAQRQFQVEGHRALTYDALLAQYNAAC